MKTAIQKPVSAFQLFSFSAFFFLLPAQLPPTNPPARLLRTNAPPRPVVQMTNIVLSWAAYTDAWFCVQASTNLTDWYFKTNVPICHTDVTLALAAPQEFFRVKTCVNIWSNPP